MANPDVLEKEGKKVVLLGNEAIARGALEAGIGMSACYPGTPSSEVGITLSDVAKKCDFYFEWSTNEKVAFEVCAGGECAGQSWQPHKLGNQPVQGAWRRLARHPR